MIMSDETPSDTSSRVWAQTKTPEVAPRAFVLL
jgi:hypothetical protein